jgi:K+-sensing histidine kinase KdpD
MMIGGEGLVFFLIMVWGIFQIQRSFNKELELAKQQKNFLLSVTHELKTPLASVRLALETLQKHTLDEVTQSKVTEQGICEADRLNLLIEKILFSTRLEDHGLLLHVRKRNLADLIDETLKVPIQTIGNKHSTTLKLEEDVYANVDEWAFKSIVINLYENALKYSPEGSTIKITLSKKEKQACLEIEDQGIGIDIEKWPDIYKKFYRVENEDTRKVKGTGLGLYIVKSLVDLHHAKIELSDVEPTGIKFLIYFKL